MVKKMKVVWIITIFLSLLSYILAFKSVIVYPLFNHIPFVLLMCSNVIGVAYGITSKCKVYKIIFSLMGFVFLGLAMNLCLFLTNPREFHEEYLSPNGLQTIIIEYDHESRPSVYRKINPLFMKKLKTPNFMRIIEVVKYDVKWLSNDEILLSGPDGYQCKIMIE